MQTIFNVLPRPTRWRQNPAGIDKKGNYVTVTLSMVTDIPSERVISACLLGVTMSVVLNHGTNRDAILGVDAVRWAQGSQVKSTEYSS